jgi:hypothetical protein
MTAESSDYIALNGTVINEQRIGKGVQGSNHGLFQDTILTSALTEENNENVYDSWSPA